MMCLIFANQTQKGMPMLAKSQNLTSRGGTIVVPGSRSPRVAAGVAKGVEFASFAHR